MSIRITLQGVPPSLNRYVGKANGYAYRQAKAEWTDTVAWMARRQRKQHKPFDKATVRIRYYFPDKRRRDPDDDLAGKFEWFGERYRVKDYRRKTVFVLTNYWSTLQEDLYRIYTLRDQGYTPFVMVYDKPNAPDVVCKLQRWCNSNRIMRSEPDFEKYMGRCDYAAEDP